MNINEIIQGDCLDKMKKMKDKSVDLVFYDPPYNKKKKYDNYDDDLPYEDYMDWMVDVILESERLSKRGFVIYIDGSMTFDFWNFLPNGDLVIIYKKAAGIAKNNYAHQYHSLLSTAKPVKRCRNVWDDIRLPGEGYYFREPRYDTPGLTGLELTKRVLEFFTFEGETILDPFMGTGTTAVAAKEMDRNYIGIEQSQKYIRIANERLANV